jgi:ABC-type branched-subunit amino acid transport system substrate-binding protein
MPIDPGGDPGPVLAKVRSSGCKAVMIIETEPGYIAIMGAAGSQGLLSQGIQWAFATSGFSNNVASKIGSSADGSIAGSEFLPYTSSSPALSDFSSLMKQSGVALDSFAEGGYIAANAAVAALKTIKGAYTTASVGAAFKAVNYSTPLLAKPFTFTTQPNKSIQVVTLKNGAWAAGSSTWITLPGQ